jgi:hypothetical protein
MEATREKGLDVIAVRQPADWAYNHASLYRNMLRGLDGVATEYVFICEHDCIYTADYFEIYPHKELSYSNEITYLTKDGFILRNLGKGGTLSTLHGRTEYIKRAITDKLHEYLSCGRVKWAEPNDGRPLRHAEGIIDIRHGSNFTGKRQGEVFGQQEAQALWRAIENGC